MAFSPEDAQAILSSANRLGVDPRTLGALMELESNVNPNVWGGDGGKYRGLIQFGPDARREVGLPDGPMTIAQQMPYVEKYMLQRGFQPGKHGPTELYRTVLVGNPFQSGTDSFGTNSDSAASRMKPGGDLYQRFSKRFDPVASNLGGAGLPGHTPAAIQAAPTASSNDPAANILAGFANAQLNLADQATKQQQALQERRQMAQLLKSVVTAGRGGGNALTGFLQGVTDPRMAGESLGLGSSALAAVAGAAMQAPANAIRALMRAAQPSPPLADTSTPAVASTDIAEPSNAIQSTGGRLARRTDYGDKIGILTPDGGRYRIIHGDFDAATNTYIQGGWGPGGRNAYGPHFDIAALDGSNYPREALDPYVLVDDQPLSRGTTVAGGEFGASRDGGSRVHRARDYAFPGAARLTLRNGARWIPID